MEPNEEVSNDIKSLLDFNKLMKIKLTCDDKGYATNFPVWESELKFYLNISNLKGPAALRAITGTLDVGPAEWYYAFQLSYLESHHRDPTEEEVLKALKAQYNNESLRDDKIQNLLTEKTDLHDIEKYNNQFSKDRVITSGLTIDQLMIHIYANGLPVTVKYHVLNEKPDDLNMAMALATQKAAELRKEKPQPSNRSNTYKISKANSTTVHCYYCKKSGHTEPNCRKKKIDQGGTKAFYERFQNETAEPKN